MLAGDYTSVENVTKKWGMGLPDLVASATLMRPVKLNRTETPEEKERRRERRELRRKEKEEGKEMTQYEMSVLMKKKLKEFLKDTDKMPKALIFLTRNMRMVQGQLPSSHPNYNVLIFSFQIGNNQSFSAPVNRIKITGYWASRSLAERPGLSFSQRLREYWHHLIFRGVMLSLDLIFWKTKVTLWTRKHFGLKPGTNFEEDLENSVRGIAKNSLGYDVGPGVFAG
jgi:aarF domain-containing kinase